MASPSRRFLLTGASGQLGSYILRESRRRDLTATGWSMRPNVELFGFGCQSVDLRKTDEVVKAFHTVKPEIVIHAAAMSGVGDCYRNPADARQTNANASRLLAELADRQKARMVHISTDLVFDGNKGWYRETDCPAPLSVYGNSKATAERAVLSHDRHLVLRLSLMFGPSINNRPSFFDQQIHALNAGIHCTLFEDEWRTPLSLQVAARCVLAVAVLDVSGLLHLGGPERMSRFEMGQRLARCIGKDEMTLVGAGREDTPGSEPRPRDTSLLCDRWRRVMPDRDDVGFETALREMQVA